MLSFVSLGGLLHDAYSRDAVEVTTTDNQIWLDALLPRKTQARRVPRANSHPTWGKNISMNILLHSLSEPGRVAHRKHILCSAKTSARIGSRILAIALFALGGLGVME